MQTENNLSSELSLKVKAGDRWEGEDEDEDVKDNWDDDDEPESESSELKPAVPGAPGAKKKSLAKRIAEKEAAARAKALEKQTPLTPEQLLAEKFANQKLQEESDLRLAREAFGITDGAASPIDMSIGLNSKEDFESFQKLLVTKLRSAERSAHYVNFLESTIRELAVPLDPDDIKRISSTLTSLYNEKLKAQKVLFLWPHDHASNCYTETGNQEKGQN